MKTENMTERQQANMQRVFDMPFSDLYPLYVTKVLKKNRSEAELREVISWLTGLNYEELDSSIASKESLSSFFASARINSAAQLITGTVCGVKVQDIDDPLLQNIRYLDKLVDELAQGREMSKILRKE